jgi:hypothetical protein
MNYDTFLMHKVLIDDGVSVNNVMFESLPYDEQFMMMGELYSGFDASGFNVPNIDLLTCLKNYVYANKFCLTYGNQIYELELDLTNHEFNTLYSYVMSGEFSNHPCGDTLYKIINAKIKIKEVNNA